MVDVRVTLTDGSYHDVDSSEMAFKVAGSMALREAARRAKPVLLEPIMAVEVVTPEEFMGDVIGDLNRRRGPDRGHGAARQRAGDPGPRAAGRDVRLRDGPAVRRRRAGPPTRCSSTATARSPRRCPRRSPSTAAAPSWARAPRPDRPGRAGQPQRAEAARYSSYIFAVGPRGALQRPPGRAACRDAKPCPYRRAQGARHCRSRSSSATSPT